jgi:hypothetical protein
VVASAVVSAAAFSRAPCCLRAVLSAAARRIAFWPSEVDASKSTVPVEQEEDVLLLLLATTTTRWKNSRERKPWSSPSHRMTSFSERNLRARGIRTHA